MLRKNNFFVILFFIFYSNFLFANTSSEYIELEDSYDDYEYDIDYDGLDYISENKNNKYTVWDPWEKMNRKIFDFNMFLTENLLDPFYYKFYKKITTEGMRKSIHNIVFNLRMPLIFANYVLQLDFENSAKTLYSFTLNTIIGVAGVFDVAGYQGVSPKNTNFGITLAKYGVPAGPYLMLPFFGPNDLRGSLAWGFEILADPLDGNIFEVGGKRDLVQSWLIWTRGTLFVLDSSTNLIENLYELLDSSFDPYVMARDAYGQSQYNKINNEE